MKVAFKPWARTWATVLFPLPLVPATMMRVGLSGVRIVDIASGGGGGVKRRKESEGLGVNLSFSGLD